MTTQNTQGASWDALYFEVMEDYITEAEMSHALRNGKDEAYYERMRGHFEKLKAYVSKERAEELRRIEKYIATQNSRVHTAQVGSSDFQAGKIGAYSEILAYITRTLPADSTERKKATDETCYLDYVDGELCCTKNHEADQACLMEGRNY